MPRARGGRERGRRRVPARLRNPCRSTRGDQRRALRPEATEQPHQDVHRNTQQQDPRGQPAQHRQRHLQRGQERLQALLEAGRDADLVLVGGDRRLGAEQLQGDRRQRGEAVELALAGLQGLEVGQAARQLRLQRGDLADRGGLRQQRADAVDARLGVVQPRLDVDDLVGHVLGGDGAVLLVAEVLELLQRRRELGRRDPQHQGARGAAVVAPPVVAADEAARRGGERDRLRGRDVDVVHADGHRAGVDDRAVLDVEVVGDLVRVLIGVLDGFLGRSGAPLRRARRGRDPAAVGGAGGGGVLLVGAAAAHRDEQHGTHRRKEQSGAPD